MNNLAKEKFLIVAGPCAAENETQIRRSIKAGKEAGIKILRASLQKPRTGWNNEQPKNNFDGLHEGGLFLLSLIADHGLIPATEVLTTNFASLVIDKIVSKKGQEVVLWLGSRNQNHLFQREVGSIVKGDKRVSLILKNQPWPDEGHLLGIVDHVLAGGADLNQIILCHRGFAPSKDGLRNPPDFEMAMRVKEKTGLPMIGDPSHSAGGSHENVLKMAERMAIYGFDGLMIEVHPNPEGAKTDKNQQLTWQEAGAFFNWLRLKQIL